MKKSALLSLVCFTLIAFAFTAWGAGRGGGGFHGGGFGGGHFGGGGGRFGGGGPRFGGGGPRFGGGVPHFSGGGNLGGGPRFGGAGHFGGGVLHFGPGAQRFSSSGARQFQMRPRATFVPTRRLPTQSAPAATTLNRRPDRRATTPQAPNIAGNHGAMHPPGARPSRTFPQRGLKGRTDHIFTRHEGNWHRGWDRHHPHFHRGHFFVFNDGFWFGLDTGIYPWDYLPYDDSDYDPYNYYTDGQPDSNTAPISDGVPVADPTVQAVQTRLAQLGYYGGPVDGIFGALTRDAVAKYQIAKQLVVTGSLSTATLQSLGLSQAKQG